MAPDSSSNEQPLPRDVDVATARRMMDEDPDLVVLDCREAAEVEFVRLEGSCWIPMGEIGRRLPELTPLRERPVLVYCHLGGRSGMVTDFLREQGFHRAQNVAGGIDAWSREIDPSLPRYS